MEHNHLEFIQPEGFAPPKGYANGVVATGKTLFVGGQIGWDKDQKFQTTDFGEQFEQALRHVVDVVKAAGGHASDIASMTIFVTDLDEYRSSTKGLSSAWKKLMERHYPAMALVGVNGLVEREAKVEILATAVLKG